MSRGRWIETDVLSTCHGAPVLARPFAVSAVADYRCWSCGHRRRPDGGAPLFRTRQMPAWTWPAEIAGRLSAGLYRPPGGAR